MNHEQIQRMVSESYLEYVRDMESIITLKIKGCTGEEFDFKQEFERKFPRVMRVFNSVDQSESWFWNDGTPEGLLLVIFSPPTLNFK